MDGSIIVDLTDPGSLFLSAILAPSLLSGLLQPRTGSSRNLGAKFPWAISALAAPSAVFASVYTCLEVVLC